MIICNKCGKENQNHYKFCLGCGAEISSASAEPVPVPQPVAPQPAAPDIEPPSQPAAPQRRPDPPARELPSLGDD